MLTLNWLLVLRIWRVRSRRDKNSKLINTQSKSHTNKMCANVPTNFAINKMFFENNIYFWCGGPNVLIDFFFLSTILIWTNISRSMRMRCRYAFSLKFYATRGRTVDNLFGDCSVIAFGCSWIEMQIMMNQISFFSCFVATHDHWSQCKSLSYSMLPCISLWSCSIWPSSTRMNV